jgi:hypothetical protein
LATISVPRIEPAPPLLSITIGWPIFSLTFLATMRATESAPPPGA